MAKTTASADSVEALIGAWLAEYRERMTTYSDLGSGTVVGRLEEAKRFLMWCQERGTLGEKLDISVADADVYVQHRASSMRRVTCAHMTRLVQVFLQFLHAIGKVPGDLSSRVIGPTLYQYESIRSSMPSRWPPCCSVAAKIAPLRVGATTPF